MRDQPPPWKVYFLRPVGRRGPIKIGCSRWPEDRLEAYTRWSPTPLEIAATIEADQKIERLLHAAFRPFRLHHEWFAWSPELEALLVSAAAGTFDLATLQPRRAAA